MVRGWRRLVSLVVVVMFVFCCVGVGVCAALPQDRVYEMVSPVFKGGFGALRIDGVAPGGDAVAFFSAGVFSESPSGAAFTSAAHTSYMARRDGSGWSTVPLVPPLTVLGATDRKSVV